MSSPSATLPASTPIHAVGRITVELLRLLGDLCLFGLATLGWIPRRFPKGHVLWPVLYAIGVESVLVVLVTGAFVGMVIAVQTYDQFSAMNMENQLGSVINITLFKELGPVLAAVMLAGRVGSAMAAELGTMRVTEQIDALSALGAEPIPYLVAPRLVACLIMVPLLTVLADVAGMISGWWFSVHALGIDHFFYWHHSLRFVNLWDIGSGLSKSVFFGVAIAVIACHRGFHCRAGAEGVGRAATEAFVYSFVAILVIDFLLGTLLMELYQVIWGLVTLR
jgi:phospholipid/cholesterol/gamma-HCH transport system permease protein